MGQIRWNYSQSRSIPSPSLPLLVVSDSANYNKGEHGLHTVFSSGSLAWGCSHTPTQAPIIHTHPHTPWSSNWMASYRMLQLGVLDLYKMRLWLKQVSCIWKTCRTTHGHTTMLLLSHAMEISQFFQCISKQCVTQNQETNMHHHFDALTHHLRTIVRQQ